MKKRFLALALASMMALTALAGCGKDDKLSESETPVAEAGEIAELIKLTAELKPYMEKGVAEGTIPQERIDELNDIVARMEQISANPENIIGTDEINEIRQTLAAMASQAAAPNEMIDSFLKGVEPPDEEPQGETATGENITSNKLPTDVAKLITDFTNLQNEASRKVETGELEQEKYMDLLSKGIEIAAIKEKLQAGGATDELVKQADNLKPYLYEIAEDINSDLKDNFK